MAASERKDLFRAGEDAIIAANAPLAVRMRPRTIDEVLGQDAFLGEGKMLRRMLEADSLSSLVLFGPPGTGKTTGNPGHLTVFLPSLVCPACRGADLGREAD